MTHKFRRNCLYISLYKYNRIIKLERLAELTKEDMRIIGEDIPIKDKCRKLIINQDEADRLMVGETDGNLISNNTKSKLSLRQLCGR